MEEKSLIKLLLIIGIISFSAIVLTNIFFTSSLNKISSSLVPLTLCMKDANSEYILSDSMLDSFCSHASDFQKLAGSPAICDAYNGSKRTACQNLIEMAKKRETDCLALAFGKGSSSINSEEIKSNCELLASV